MLSIYRPFSFNHISPDSQISAKNYFDRLFEDAFNSTFRDISPINQSIGVEFEKSDSLLTAYIDMPGVKDSDVNIEVSDDGVVTVKATRSRGVSSQEISRSFSIPKEYDVENISAELSDGVLSLKLPIKPPELKNPKKIIINNKK